MPRNFDFIKKYVTKQKKPLKPKVNLRSTRDRRLIIREGAIQRKQVIIIYKKITTGEVKRYLICPMSYRYRKLKSGIKKVLFAEDMQGRQLKNFVMKNIRQAILTDRKYVKINYPIEID